MAEREQGTRRDREREATHELGELTQSQLREWMIWLYAENRIGLKDLQEWQAAMRRR